MKDLGKLREQLDVIDDRIVDLLKERADLVLEVKKTKERENINTYSPAREKQIMDRILDRARDGNFPINQLEKIFGNIISVSRSLIGDLQVAYLAGRDNFSQQAAIKQFGDAVNFVSESSQEDLFLAVEKGRSNFGVLPFSISATERLINSSASIVAELELKETSTHYLVIGRVPAAVTGKDKTSIALILQDRPGILSEVLKPLTDSQISLLNIQSKLINSEEYFFYLELRGNSADADVKQALEKLSKLCRKFRILGSYPLVFEASKEGAA